MGASPTPLIMSFSYGGYTRQYLLRFPVNYNGAKAGGYALFILCHGNGGTAPGMEAFANMDQVADQFGFVVCYAISRGTSWDVSGTQYDDVAVTNQIIRTIIPQANINPNAIYIAGYSEGGGFATQMVIGTNAIPGLFAGLGVVSDNLNSPTASVVSASMPLPYINFHGTADPIVPEAGGESANGTNFVMSSQATTQVWATLAGCPDLTAPPEFTFTGRLNNGATGPVNVLSWAPGTSGWPAQYWRIGGGGHTWPGGNQNALLPTANIPALGPTSLDVHASLIMWNYLSKFQK